jgi:hypothetical protein
MTEYRRYPRFEQALVAAAVATAAILCVLSYLADRSCREKIVSNGQIDLLSGNLAERWKVFGALNAPEVSFERTNMGAVEAKIHPDTPAWSEVSSGVSYRAGLFVPGWYEFIGDFRADVNDIEGIGAQLEVHSDRWRFITKARAERAGSIGKKINVYFRPSATDPGAEISCRFWGQAGDHTARAVFQNMHIAKIAGTPPRTALRFDLEKTDEARPGNPKHSVTGSHRSVWVTVLFLELVAGICWRLLE